MAKYWVKTKIMQVFSSVVEAETQDEAEKIAVGLTDDLIPVDAYWHDSETVQVDDDTDTDD